ncbi:MAG: hypothetical protein R2704_01160 [Microthrixaceae bacterium]
MSSISVSRRSRRPRSAATAPRRSTLVRLRSVSAIACGTAPPAGTSPSMPSWVPSASGHRASLIRCHCPASITSSPTRTTSAARSGSSRNTTSVSGTLRRWLVSSGHRSSSTQDTSRAAAETARASASAEP